MTNYAVYDPNDVRKVHDKHHALKRIGAAVVRPATDAERAQFAPLHAALARQSRVCKEKHWEHQMAARKAVSP